MLQGPIDTFYEILQFFSIRFSHYKRLQIQIDKLKTFLLIFEIFILNLL